MREDLAISITGLKKKYKLGAIGGGTLKGDVQSWWARKRGKEDPNSIIGTDDTKVGEEFYALNGINLEVKKGEALGIIGMNGAGKSTLLKILSRVTAPSEGEVHIRGRITSMLEVGTGFHGELTGRENIYMNGAILGMTRKEVDEKIEEIIDFSECRQFIDTPVKRYSSGMYVKLAFAVAAHLDSEIMIMDEVLAVGDMRFQTKCLDKMRVSSRTDKKTILYVSHNMNTIRQLCDRCIVLEKGQIVYVGDVEKSIEMYMKKKMDYSSYRNLRGVTENCIITKSIDLLEVQFVDKEFPNYSQSEKMKVRVLWKANEPNLNVYIRLLPYFVDGTGIGMGMTISPCSPQRGEVIEDILQLDISCLVPGTYYLNITLFQVNEYGTDELLGGVKEGLFFEVKKSKERNLNIEWSRASWGLVSLPNVEIISRSAKNV